MEIDEYRDYEKAVGALREALKYLGKDTSRAAEDMASSIERRIMLIEKFVQAKRSAKKDPANMVAICQVSLSMMLVLVVVVLLLSLVLVVVLFVTAGVIV